MKTSTRPFAHIPSFRQCCRILGVILLFCALLHVCFALAGARDPRIGMPLYAPGFEVPGRVGIGVMRLIPLAGSELRSPVVSPGGTSARPLALLGG